jgi:hypothetical protein
MKVIEQRYGHPQVKTLAGGAQHYFISSCIPVYWSFLLPNLGQSYPLETYYYPSSTEKEK